MLRDDQMLVGGGCAAGRQSKMKDANIFTDGVTSSLQTRGSCCTGEAWKVGMAQDS